MGSSETPALAQPLPVLSRRGFHGGRVWQGGTISRQIQSTTVLSAMRPIFSTSEPPPERTAARVEQPDRKTETAWTVLATVATLPLTPLLPQPASCIHAVKPSTHAPTRDKHALPPLRIRAVQVFNTRPRANHSPVPTNTPEQRHLLSSTCSVRASDGTAGLRRGLVAPMLNDARCAGQTVRPTTELFFPLNYLRAGCRAISPLPMGALWSCAMQYRSNFGYCLAFDPFAPRRGICRRPTGRR